MLQRLALAVLGHLLARERWARERLAPFAGRTIEFSLAPFAPFTVAINVDGTLRAATPADESPALTARASGEVLGAMAKGDAWWAELALAGDPPLAETVRDLAEYLRWDPADDLARIVGDIPAERIAQAGTRLAAWQRDARERLGAGMADYLSIEKRLIASRADLDAFAAQVREAADALAALEARVAALERGSG